MTWPTMHEQPDNSLRPRRKMRSRDSIRIISRTHCGIREHASPEPSRGKEAPAQLIVLVSEWKHGEFQDETLWPSLRMTLMGSV